MSIDSLHFDERLSDHDGSLTVSSRWSSSMLEIESKKLIRTMPDISGFVHFRRAFFQRACDAWAMATTVIHIKRLLRYHRFRIPCLPVASALIQTADLRASQARNFCSVHAARDLARSIRDIRDRSISHFVYDKIIPRLNVHAQNLSSVTGNRTREEYQLRNPARFILLVNFKDWPWCVYVDTEMTSE